MKGLLKSSRATDERGMALLITIMVVSLLIGITVQFGKNARQSYFSSAAQLEGQTLTGLARSGVAIAATFLEADSLQNTFDSSHDQWADISGGLGELFGQGNVHITVEDLSGRLQINSLVEKIDGGAGAGDGANVNENREILNHVLVSSILVEEREERAREIIESIIDWLDPDDEENDFGAESGYYRSLADPYEAGNSSFRDIDELLNVKGISPKVLYGEGEQPGLADFITVHGDDGKMNINTMPKGLLTALHPLMNEELAEMLDSFRLSEENSDLLEKPDWYRRVPGFPGDIEFPAAVLTTKSSFFRVRSEGQLTERSRRVVATIERKAEGETAIIKTRME